MSDTLEYLFVYGTLRRDSGSAPYRKFISPHFTFISRATIPGMLYYMNDYPGLIPAEKTTDLVIGELYSFTGGEAQLAAIDKYEGCGEDTPEPHLFSRCHESVSMKNGSVKTAWTYYYNFPVSKGMLIRSGDFLDPF